MKATEGPFCTGNNKHPWGQYNISVVYSQDRRRWMRLYPRPSKLRADIVLQLCDESKCRRTKSKNSSSSCTHPHCQEELDLWKYQVKHKCKCQTTTLAPVIITDFDWTGHPCGLFHRKDTRQYYLRTVVLVKLPELLSFRNLWIILITKMLDHKVLYA